MLIPIAIILTAVLAWEVHPAPPHPDFRVVPAAYFREREHTVPYETTAKIIFRVHLPTLNTTAPPVCSPIDVLCRAKVTLYQTYHFNTEIIQTLAEKTSRGERQVGVLAAAAGGYFLSSMISKFSSKLFGSEADVSNEIEKIRSSMRHNNKEFLLFESSVHKFASEMTSTVTAIQSREQDIMVALNIFAAVNTIQNKFRNIEIGLQNCINGYLPFTLIEADVLRRSLHNVSRQISPMGLRLTLPTKNIEEYYKLNIADCIVTSSSITVMANIPVAIQNWKIVDVLPIPFAFENHTCTLATPQPMRIATGKTIVVFDSYSLQFCDTNNGHLCFVPSLMRSSGRLQSCIKNMFKGIISQSTLQHCPMDCDSSNEPRIFEVTPGKIVATNVKSIHVECPLHEQDYSVDTVGAIEVTLRCRCSYMIGPYNISNHLACLEGEHFFQDVVGIVPDAWTVLEYSPEFLLKATLKHSALSHNLSIDLPIQASDLQVPFLSYSFDLTGVLLIIVTVVCIVLVLIVVVLAHSHLKLLAV